jgi:hypothetical protein
VSARCQALTVPERGKRLLETHHVAHRGGECTFVNCHVNSEAWIGAEGIAPAQGVGSRVSSLIAAKIPNERVHRIGIPGGQHFSRKYGKRAGRVVYAAVVLEVE